LLATQTSAIITRYGELTSTTTIYGGDHALTTTTWKPINKDHLLNIRGAAMSSEHCVHNFFNSLDRYYDDPHLLPPDNFPGRLLWRHEYIIQPNYDPGSYVQITYEIYLHHYKYQSELATIIYLIGDITTYTHTEDPTYDRATRNLTITTSGEYPWARFRYTPNDASISISEVYYPIVTSEYGETLPIANVKTTHRERTSFSPLTNTVTAVYENVDIDPTVQYYITHAAKDDHIQCAPPIPVTINFINSAG
jgi:hypothetical protein